MNLEQDSIQTIRSSIKLLSHAIYENSIAHGFYEDPNQRVSEKLMLIVTELAEACETNRSKTPNRPDDHCPEFTNFEIELADAMIRIMDLAEWQKARLAEAIIAKHFYNKNRPYKHGKSY